MGQITDLKARKIVPSGRPMADGAISGLRLEPGSANGHGKWILRFVSPATKKRRDMGLGTYPEVGIADAGIRGMGTRQTIASGKDPIEDGDAGRATRKAIAEAMTFEQASRGGRHSELGAGRVACTAEEWLANSQKGQRGHTNLSR